MDIEERIKTLQDEFPPVQEEVKKILYDIRTWIMEAQSPIPNDLEKEQLGNFINDMKKEQKESRSNTAKGVE
ncbi:hypothetical protein ACFLV2_02515 [Chloroflexota bacterium]